uniref:C2 dehydratase n=1 Tax=Streptomyces sp. WAC2288 TaxID=1582798 RepID=A0A1I9J5M6_9ACTN|nr:C2 dehydratase [Streptomyces sp. WAC2288]
MTTSSPLQFREDLTLPSHLAASAAGREAGTQLRTDQFLPWLAERRRAHHFMVRRIPLSALEDWSFAPDTGNLRHRSGQFFSVEGLHARAGQGPVREWYQPIIQQPEVGILGILAKQFDGVLHFLMQAKMEPGNPNLLQLSPTVQATRSNYSKVHRGADVKYIDYFTQPRQGSVLADVLQSEHGSWFYRKFNRNMLVRTDDEVPVDDDFCWLTLGQLGELLCLDNVVNMDARTVLACLPAAATQTKALHSDTELLSWFTGERARREVRTELIPLRAAVGWDRDTWAISHRSGRYFRVVAAAVEATNREVTGWTQPLFEPVAEGTTAFLTRRFDGVPHVLAHARAEGGFLDTVELGPTLQYTPENYAHLDAADHPAYTELLHDLDPARIRYEAIHSEEGGRFLNATSRCLFIDAPDIGPDVPPSYRWVTPGQLNSLTRHGHYVNVQARTLLACLNTGALAL